MIVQTFIFEQRKVDNSSRRFQLNLNEQKTSMSSYGAIGKFPYDEISVRCEQTC